MTAAAARSAPVLRDAAAGSSCDVPLSFFYRAHLRHRRLCMALSDASASPVAVHARAVELVAELQHLSAAENLLFRLLRARAEPEDDITGVLGILEADQDASREAACALAAGPLVPSAQPGEARLHAAIERLVARQLRAIALENAVVLPIARLRLTDADIAQLADCLNQGRAATDAAPVPPHQP